MEEEEVNLIKKLRKDMNLSYRELSKILGYSENTLRQSVSRNIISVPLEQAIKEIAHNK